MKIKVSFFAVLVHFRGLVAMPAIFMFSLSVQGQDMEYAHKVINDLCAPEMFGRGYVNNGDEAAAHYLRTQLEKLGVQAFDFNYYQDFKMSVNTFPDSMQVEVDGKLLQPGLDYIVSPESHGVSGTFDIIWLNKEVIGNDRNMRSFEKEDKKSKVIVLDTTGLNKDEKEYFKKVELNPWEAAAIVKLIPEKLTWGVSQEEAFFTTVEVLKGAFPAKARKIKLNIRNKFLPKYLSQNILGFIEGKRNPDSSIVVSAHYDHLGLMGASTIFPGANDNASGTAMVLSLAAYYAKPENRPDYTIVFMFFGAEEAGLVGSKFYTENPAFPLEEIKFLINIDLAGTGDEGITVVNGSVFEKEFNKMVELNAAKNYLVKVKVRGKAANSDHYFFTEKGVPSFFIYTMGGIKAYHDVYDKPETLPLTEFQDLFKLLTDFVKTL